MGGLSPSLTSSNQSTPTGPDDATAFNYPPVGAVSFRFPSVILVWSGSVPIPEFPNFLSSLRQTATWATSLLLWIWTVRRNRPAMEATNTKVAAPMAGAPERSQNPRPEFTEIIRMNRRPNLQGMKLQATRMSRIRDDSRLNFQITVNILLGFDPSICITGWWGWPIRTYFWKIRENKKFQNSEPKYHVDFPFSFVRQSFKNSSFFLTGKKIWENIKLSASIVKMNFYFQLQLMFIPPLWFDGLHWVKLEATKWSTTSVCSARTTEKTRSSISVTRSKTISAGSDVQSYGTTNALFAAPRAQFPTRSATALKTRTTSTTRISQPSLSWNRWGRPWVSVAHLE